MAPLSPCEAMERLFPVTSIPWYHAEVLPDLLDFVGAVARETLAGSWRSYSTSTADTIAAAVRMTLPFARQGDRAWMTHPI